MSNTNLTTALAHLDQAAANYSPSTPKSASEDMSHTSDLIAQATALATVELAQAQHVANALAILDVYDDTSLVTDVPAPNGATPAQTAQAAFLNAQRAVIRSSIS